MSWISYDYRCKICDHIETHLQPRGDVSEYEYCTQEGCDGECTRMYGCFVSTSKTSRSIPAGTTTRFGKIKESLAAKKALSAAKQAGDTAGANEVRAEIKKINRRKS